MTPPPAHATAIAGMHIGARPARACEGVTFRSELTRGQHHLRVISLRRTRALIAIEIPTEQTRQHTPHSRDANHTEHARPHDIFPPNPKTCLLCDRYNRYYGVISVQDPRFVEACKQEQATFLVSLWNGANAIAEPQALSFINHYWEPATADAFCSWKLSPKAGKEHPEGTRSTRMCVGPCKWKSIEVANQFSHLPHAPTQGRDEPDMFKITGHQDKMRAIVDLDGTTHGAPRGEVAFYILRPTKPKQSAPLDLACPYELPSNEAAPGPRHDEAQAREGWTQAVQYAAFISRDVPIIDIGTMQVRTVSWEEVRTHPKVGKALAESLRAHDQKGKIPLLWSAMEEVANVYDDPTTARAQQRDTKEHKNIASGNGTVGAGRSALRSMSGYVNYNTHNECRGIAYERKRKCTPHVGRCGGHAHPAPR